jgi:hypothetical protein
MIRPARTRALPYLSATLSAGFVFKVIDRIWALPRYLSPVTGELQMRSFASEPRYLQITKELRLIPGSAGIPQGLSRPSHLRHRLRRPP